MCAAGIRCDGGNGDYDDDGGDGDDDVGHECSSECWKKTAE